MAERRETSPNNLKMQLLGHLHIQAPNKFKFSVGERTFATLGSMVRVPSDAALAFLCNVGLEDDPTATPLGHLVYGQRELKTVPVRFSVGRLKGRRSFRLCAGGLWQKQPHQVPDVPALFFPARCRPADLRPGRGIRPARRSRSSGAGQCARAAEPDFALHQPHGGTAARRCGQRAACTVDFGDFPPQDIVAVFVAQEKQDSVFANLLRSMDWDRWKELVALLAKDGFATEDRKIAELLSYRPQPGRQQQNDVSLSAIKNNLVPPIKRLHRAGATLGKNIIQELKDNCVVIADVSLLGSEDGLAITGMLLRRIFQNNVRHLTDRKAGQTVRCLAVLEEAQTMLGDRTLDERNVFCAGSRKAVNTGWAAYW